MARITLERLEAFIANQERIGGVAPTDMWVSPDAKADLDESFRALSGFPDLPPVSRVTLDTGPIEITVKRQLPPGTIYLFNRDDMPEDTVE